MARSRTDDRQSPARPSVRLASEPVTSADPTPEPPRPVRLHDPRSIRALAHPARLAVIEELYSSRAELTATECAAIAGLSPSAMSYHLRSLEKAGIVERAESKGDGRERPWRASGRYLQVDSDDSSAAGDAASSALSDVVLDRLIRQFTAYMGRRGAESKEWREVSGVSSGQLWLRPEEVAALVEGALDAADGFRDRAAGTRPPGARRVRISLIVHPVEPETGSVDD
jgi:DNA-binding transcriptional ArsR family regulator